MNRLTQRTFWIFAALLLAAGLLFAPRPALADGGGWPTATPTITPIPPSPTPLILLPTATTASFDLPAVPPTQVTGDQGNLPLAPEDLIAQVEATPAPTAARFSLISYWPALLLVGIVAVGLIFFALLGRGKKA